MKNRRVECARCGELIKEKDFNYHKQRHTPGNELSCDKCGKFFISLVALRKHGLRVHGMELKCEECGRDFSKPEYFIRHVKFGHAVKSYTCVICNYATPESNQLRMHMEKRHLKNYTLHCKICGRGFFDKSSLREHENIHSGVSPYQCEACGESFKLKSTLRAHKIRFHAYLFPHECKICGKGLSTLGGLKSHLKLHADDRKFMCDICGKRLTTSRSLEEHRRLHTMQALPKIVPFGETPCSSYSYNPYWGTTPKKSFMPRL